MFLHVGVEELLKSMDHVALDHVLHLVRQLRLHLLLQPPEQERAKNFVQATDDQDRLFLVQIHLLMGCQGLKLRSSTL